MHHAPRFRPRLRPILLLLPPLLLLSLRLPALPSLSAPARTLNCASPRRLGDAYGGWVICQPVAPAALRDALVYTVGVGRNIAWDRAMIDAYHTRHHAWDPTPTALDFVSKVPTPARFVFHPVGLAAHDGNLTLKLPDGNQDSYTVMEFRNPAQEGTVVSVPVLTVESMLTSLNHTRLAILKIDIEGAEFALIDEWSKTGYRPPTDQLLIELHERYFQHQPGWKTMVPDAIKKLNYLGFNLINRTKLEITFASRDAIAIP